MKRLRITIDGNVYEVEVEILEDRGKIEKDRKSIAEQAATFGKSRQVSKKIIQDVNSNAIKSPLAGNIVEIKVKEGDLIKESDLVMVIEAMKMNTNIYAPRSARVKRILCKVGDRVEYGQDLIELE